VTRKLLLPFALLVPLCLALYTSSCGPTCPNLQPCGTTSGATGDAGSSSAGGTSTDTTTCDQLTALQTCLTAYCKIADNPFCDCYKRGFDLGPSPACACVAFSPTEYCQEAAAQSIDAANFDCSATTGGIASLCVGVQ
jgi:hypothetical protein